MTDTDTRTATATARQAGAKIVHQVTVTGPNTTDAIGNATRRSAHRYGWAICRWVSVGDARTVCVDRWSTSAKCSAARRQFAVAVQDA